MGFLSITVDERCTELANIIFPISKDSYLLTEADYTLCLDALAGGSELFLHMSKPPKLGTKAHEILEHLNKVR